MSAIIRVNGKDETLAAATVAELLRGARHRAARAASPSRSTARWCRRGAWAETALAAGDQVEIVRPFGGG